MCFRSQKSKYLARPREARRGEVLICRLVNNSSGGGWGGGGGAVGVGIVFHGVTYQHLASPH